MKQNLFLKNRVLHFELIYVITFYVHQLTFLKIL